jgi:hypothetical protein
MADIAAGHSIWQKAEIKLIIAAQPDLVGPK